MATVCAIAGYFQGYRQVGIGCQFVPVNKIATEHMVVPQPQAKGRCRGIASVQQIKECRRPNQES